MAAMTVSRNAIVVRRLHSLSSWLSHLRHMSSTGAPNGETNTVLYHEKGDSNARTWPDKELLSFDPYYDPFRFPMPGNVGPTQQPKKVAHFVTHYTTVCTAHTSARAAVLTEKELSEYCNYDRQAGVLTQFNPAAASLPDQNGSEPESQLELKIQDCPLLVRKDFQDLFPGVNILRGTLTIISMCQKTTNDMSSWTPDVECEREALMELYVATCTEVCESLKFAGFWADFIDPSSGKPFLGAHTPASMFETDERYRHFGFDIEDLGCCKVVKHHKWGTKAYVGCIFTDAPSTHPVLLEIEGEVSS